MYNVSTVGKIVLSFTERRMKSGRVIKKAFKKTIPVLIGYLFLGFSFGVLLTASGFDLWYAPLMSVTLYAGSMQFVAIELMLGAFNLVNAAIMTLLVNARHLFYGLSLVDKYKGTGLYKFYLMFGLTDETYALVSSLEEPRGEETTKLYFYITLFDHLYWILGGLLGATVGTLIAFPSKGLEFTMTALFLDIFVEQGEASKTHVPALCGVAVTLACLLLFGTQYFLLVTMAILLILLTVLRKKLEPREAALPPESLGGEEFADQGGKKG